MLVHAMRDIEHFREHFFQIRCNFLGQYKKIKQIAYGGVNRIANNTLYSSPEELDSRVEGNLLANLAESNVIQTADTLFRNLNSIQEISIKLFELVVSLQHIEANKLEDWRFTGYIRVAILIKKTSELYWDFFDIRSKLWEINVIAWAYEIVRYSSLPTDEICNSNNIVLAPGKPGVVFHEVGHMLECDNIREQLGTNFKSKFSIVDDPLLLQYNGSYLVDDNGNVAKKTTMIDSGQIVSPIGMYISDCSSVTTCGRRMNYKWHAIPRMSVTFLVPGSFFPADIINRIDDGILVKSITNNYALPRTGVINFSYGLSYPIKNGEVDINFRCIQQNRTISLNGLLNGIREVGNDLMINTGRGLCNKKGQEIVCSYGMPTTHIVLE